MKSDAARNGGASNTGTGYLPFTKDKGVENRKAASAEAGGRAPCGGGV